ncbi:MULTISPECIES: IMPACT family protein [Dickeya]|uniref:FIG000605: protein co-occurring with transport systems (COG1739) n=1 Tax=Dickeya aquatica TaxID=1401087 RepID=A0A375A5U4_9GAMM|nr:MULTISPECIES: IMPACT family protein [Dickeya]SLM61393.1 FIG000605: protein co-occurring with transport systems (COG1739) [Dickeya aquatica]
MQSYPIPATSVSVQEEIKKSRFLTLLSPACGVAAAREVIQQVRHAHPDAAHHCWAYVAGAPDDSQQLGFSDDGEPSGTAGKPMLAQLMGSGMGEVVAVVVRYYGGIQLGTGGLVKAYGGGVQQALKQLPVQQKVMLQPFRLQCDYALLSQVESTVQALQGQVIASEYTSQVSLLVALPVTVLDEAARRLRDMSRGALHLQSISQ